jgi:long-chain acyl-CoA synthetase
MRPADILRLDFATIPQLLRAHAHLQPEQVALIHDGRRILYSALDQMADRIAAALQRDGLMPRDLVAIAAATTIDYVAIFLGGLRAGVAVAPLPMASGSRALAAMIADTAARKLFLDRAAAAALADGVGATTASTIVIDAPGGPSLQSGATDLQSGAIGPHQGATGIQQGAIDLQRWMMEAGSVPKSVDVRPDWPFNVIYSSGTTGVPKGIVQPHAFRWSNVQRAVTYGYGPDCVTLLATPLYSNTTLATLFGVIAVGGTAVLMGKFNTDSYLTLAQDCHATHTVLVPVQYQRLLANENFDEYDLSSFRMKFSTGAPFAPALKQQVLERWPGGLMEIYGMTEGGGACMLEAHRHRTKLHTVGTPMLRNEIRLIDAADREVAAGETGEVVGRSPAMMTGYLNQPSKTAEAEWRDSRGERFIRTGDIGRMDGDGFLILLDRKKDMIISGGFNVYPCDLEAVLREHPAVLEAAVVGVASARWGETPVACVVLNDGADMEAASLTVWANERLGKIQRLAAVRIMTSLPRNAAGKILKGELRDSFVQTPPANPED